jgi:hypothetical protein
VTDMTYPAAKANTEAIFEAFPLIFRYVLL